MKHMLITIALLLCSSVANSSNKEYQEFDSTDKSGERSGLIILIDQATGCHYLKAGDTLIPRMQFNGKQVCSGQIGEEALMKVYNDKR